MKHFYIAAITLLLAACVDPGAQYQSNVYRAGQLNQRQEIKTVSILSIVPAKIEVDNTKNQEVAQGVGALLGAVTGVALANNKNDVGGGILGGLAGAGAGGLIVKDKKLVSGVQIIYQEGSRVLSSAQIGRPCDFAIGTALVVVSASDETRIQSNHDCIKGQEAIIGRVSKLGNGVANIKAEDQGSLDDLERQRRLLTKKRQVQEQITGLTKEEQRSRNARESADIELERERNRAHGY